ncbi:MAG: transporter [SAR86 cluster bacterium]|uniref:Transporter n=1 Tax=SAR86 cluster bacterium TaxID=2030880 RepID=A0A2A5ATE5_9GAMM|nr:MAG: transporter [SAR86 cluster bacterium]
MSYFDSDKDQIAACDTSYDVSQGIVLKKRVHAGNLDSGAHDPIGQQVESLLDGFAHHGLKDTEAQSLMSRFDTKYLVHTSRLNELLQSLKQDYSVLSIDNKQLMRYENEYLDTENFSFYNDHHNKRLNRTKVRCRRYVDSDTSFIEIKAKNNKGRTVKNRKQLNGSDELAQIAPEMLQQYLPGKYPACQLESVAKITYRRISLQSDSHNERVSIDLCLAATRQDNSRSFEMHDLAIVELKQTRANRESPLFHTLRNMGMYSSPFSKYCISCALLYAELLRTNRFKMLLARLQSRIKFNNTGV